ncbi:MAG: hypothetical protein PHV12_02275 [Bacteroidales bacterium]|jgi:hypothetical protein|nr:hypothetical protein [Bacteroidales bacterium]
MIYRLKATIDGNKIFMREYEVKGVSSLYSFHLFLQSDLGFAPDQMVIFRGLSKSNKVKTEYGLFDMGDGSMDKVSVESAFNSGIEFLMYVYNMFKDRGMRLELIGTEEPLSRRSYPRLVAEKGRNPDQFSDDYDDFESILPQPDLDEGYSPEELPEGEL